MGMPGRPSPGLDDYLYWQERLSKSVGLAYRDSHCRKSKIFSAIAFCRLSLEDGVPDHSSFGRVRDRFGEGIYEAVFHETAKRCQAHGLVAPFLAIDDITITQLFVSEYSAIRAGPSDVRDSIGGLESKSLCFRNCQTRGRPSRVHSTGRFGLRRKNRYAAGNPPSVTALG